MTADAYDTTVNASHTSSKSRTAPRHEEYQYLDLIRRILNEGEHRPDRTGTGTLSLFAPPQLRFFLSR